MRKGEVQPQELAIKSGTCDMQGAGQLDMAMVLISIELLDHQMSEPHAVTSSIY